MKLGLKLGWWSREVESRESVSRQPVSHRLWTALLLAGLLPAVVTQPAHAQVPVRFELGAGAAFPSSPGNANHYWNTGYTLSAGARWRLDARWSFGLDLGFAHFQPDVPEAAPPEQTFAGALHVIPILLAAEFALSEWSNTRPFVSAHAGYVRVRMSDPDAGSGSGAATPPPQPDSDAFGLGFGIGVRTLLTPSADLVVDVGWRVALSDPDQIAWIPVRAAVRF